MLDWDKLRIFYNVVKGGSFRGTVPRLGVGQSSISRQVSSLEQRLGSPVFYRHASGLRLTPQGKMLFQATREVFADIAMIEAQIKDAAHGGGIPLTIASSIGFGTSWLIPQLNKFKALHPNLRLTVNLSDEPVDLSTRESDIAITSEITEDDTLEHKKLISRPLNVYASAGYLKKYGTPKSLDDLDEHRLVTFEGKDKIPFPNASWLLTCGTAPGIQRKPFLTFNNLNAIAAAVAAGCGVGCLPSYIAETHPGLVPILSGAEVPMVHFYFVYPRLLKNLQMIDTLQTFLEEEARH